MRKNGKLMDQISSLRKLLRVDSVIAVNLYYKTFMSSHLNVEKINIKLLKINVK